jgi:molybdenum cofactor guanylyltransferase
MALNMVTHRASQFQPKGKYPCTGIILSGGLGIRFHRENKALALLGNERVLESVIRVFRDIFDEIFIVTNSPLSYTEWDLPIVTDIYPVRSPLVGIYTGLLYAAFPHVFVTACDTPFLQKQLLTVILESIDSKADIWVPETAKGFEPLCAVYSNRCLPSLEAVISANLDKVPAAPGSTERYLEQSLKIRSFFSRVRVKTIDEERIRAVDPHLYSFFNINTPEDLLRAEAILSESRKEAE